MIQNSRNLIEGAPLDSEKPEGPRALGLKSKAEMVGEGEDEYYLNSIASCSEKISKYEKAIAEVRNVDRRLGYVFASSGIDHYSGPTSTTALENGQLQITGPPTDWALIRMKSLDRFLFPNPTPTCPAWVSLDYGGSSPSIHCANKRDIEAGEFLYQKGRNRLRAGVTTSIKCNIKFDDSKKLFKSWVVTGRHVIHATIPPYDKSPPPSFPVFMYGGDSGTWILEGSGILRGYGFGGDLETGAGYIVSAKEMYEDITGRTGVEIIETRLI